MKKTKRGLFYETPCTDTVYLSTDSHPPKAVTTW